MRKLAALSAVALMLLSGCTRKRPRAVPPSQATPGWSQTGIASWYGYPYHGRRTASGEVYDMESLTAAHRTLPFNTWVEVLNFSNRKTVQVRINDRGPFVDGRIIDLSRAAARAIDLLGPGIAKVRIQVIPPPAISERAPAPAAPSSLDPPAPADALASAFSIQAGAFRSRESAEALRSELERRFGVAYLLPLPADQILWRVLAGPFRTRQEAETAANLLRADGVECFLVRGDGRLLQ